MVEGKINWKVTEVCTGNVENLSIRNRVEIERKGGHGKNCKDRPNKLSLLLMACREKKRESNQWGFNNWRRGYWLAHVQGTEEKAEPRKRHADIASLEKHPYRKFIMQLNSNSSLKIWQLEIYIWELAT